MSKASRIQCRKAKNDADFERARAFNARPIPSGAFKELSGIPTEKRSIWEAIKHDDFLAAACKAWQPVEIEHNGRYWKK